MDFTAMHHRQINILLLMVLVVLLLAIIIKNNSPHLHAAFLPTVPPVVLLENVPVSSSNQFVPAGDWKIKHAAKHHEIEGYSSALGVVSGSNIQFAVSSATATYTATIYRMGWYDGEGAAQVVTYKDEAGHLQLIPKADPQTGLVQPAWPYQLQVKVPTKWPTGMYFMKLTNADGYGSYVPFVVEHGKPQQAILLVHSVLTDQAYNDWGGNSLYHGFTPALNIPRAVEVSLDRPLAEYDGAGYFLEWEYPMVRWLEKNNYQVDYATDIDVHNHPELLKKYKLVMIVGHDEYWSKAMRDGYEAAVASGTNLAVFAANTAYRQVRIEGTTVVNYKSAYMHDPMYGKDNSVVTGSWRDAPVNRPESTLIGASYGTEVDKAYPFVVTDSENWIYAHSGLKNGQAIDQIVGYECDAVQPDLPKPAHLITLSSSPVKTKVDKDEIGEGTDSPNSNATIYTAASGAIVFNAATIGWSSGLDNFGEKYPHVSQPLQTITANIIQRLSK